jgi:hypothetical protein
VSPELPAKVVVEFAAVKIVKLKLLNSTNSITFGGWNENLVEPYFIKAKRLRGGAVCTLLPYARTVTDFTPSTSYTRTRKSSSFSRCNSFGLRIYTCQEITYGFFRGVEVSTQDNGVVVVFYDLILAVIVQVLRAAPFAKAVSEFFGSASISPSKS